MNEFQRVLDADELADPGKTLVEVDGEMIALFHIGGEFLRSMMSARTTVDRWRMANLLGIRLPAPVTARSLMSAPVVP